ncbi:transporter [bacterium]|nr:transporter [bacterium]
MPLSSLFQNALAVAMLAAIGNALFVFGQRRSEVATNPFIFISAVLVICISLFALTVPFFDRSDLGRYVQRNVLWIVISGFGFYLTFVGFYFLYTRFGASYYVLYAVLSILTTTVFVGLVVFREQVNAFHLAAIGTAILTVVLFGIGQARS